MLSKRITYSFMVLCLVSLSIIASVWGSELRPYQLPSQQRSVMEKQLPEGSQNGETVDESVYKDFEEKVRAMGNGNKLKLKEAFSKRRDEAIKNGRIKEAKYYLRLLKILNNP
jgi:hypothetical protein